MTETPEQFIERVRAYAEKATKGPWEWYRNGIDSGLVGANGKFTSFFGEASEGAHYPGDPDAEFAKGARIDLPAALLIIETLVAERDAARVAYMDLMESVSRFTAAVAAMKGVPSE